MPVPYRLVAPSALVVAFALTGAAVGGAALARDTQDPRPRSPPEQIQPAPPPGENAPEPEGRTVPPSDSLSHSGGVVAPPPIGDRNVATPPSDGTGTMPAETASLIAAIRQAPLIDDPSVRCAKEDMLRALHRSHAGAPRSAVRGAARRRALQHAA